jgi:hypothetical protein
MWAETLKMDTESFSETLASTNQSTWRFNPKDHHQNFHRRENLKFSQSHVLFSAHPHRTTKACYPV